MIRVTCLLKNNKNKILISSLFLIFISISFHTNFTSIIINYNQEEPNSSGFWATLDLTNPIGINNTRLQTNSIINVQGRLYNLFNGSGMPGYTVAIYIDGIHYSNFNDITNGNGDFDIQYTIDPSLDVFDNHRLDVFVDSPTPPGNIDYTSYFNFSLNAASLFEVSEPQSAFLTGEFLNFEGYLKFQSNGVGIPSALINYYWSDEITIVDSGSFFTSANGQIPQDSIIIPEGVGSNLNLTLNYSDLPYINYSEIKFVETKIFSNITCIWDLPVTAVEYNRYIIAGYLVSRTDNSIPINNRAIVINYNGVPIDTVFSDASGYFTYTFNLPSGPGLNLIEIEVENDIGKSISTFQTIDVDEGSPQSVPEPPFLGFFLIFIPVLSGIILGLIGYGYYYYRKQDKVSRIVNLPLESRILNLKILKDSGRLEESISYLFNGIYMELIKAKFGRIRENNETIRDFAIVSVKDLKLNPTSIYPFIQKIEEIIYARPFQISDTQFYSTIELFSPVYFQLTGYNFELNF